jgi:hypothetical protein
MNINLVSLLPGLLPKLLGFSLNFVDDLIFLFLSHWGIHWGCLQFCSYGLIVGKLIYLLLKLDRNYFVAILKLNSFFIDKYRPLVQPN